MSELPPISGLRLFTVYMARRDAVSDTKGRLEFEVLQEQADTIRAQIRNGVTWISFLDRDSVRHLYRASQLRYVKIKEIR